MVDRLRELQASSPDIEASAVVSVDGLSIASALPREVEEDRVSAMSAAMLSWGRESPENWAAVALSRSTSRAKPAMSSSWRSAARPC